jgi:hypothetical protein
MSVLRRSHSAETDPNMAIAGIPLSSLRPTTENFARGPEIELGGYLGNLDQRLVLFGLRGLTAIVISVIVSVPFSFVVHAALALIFRPHLSCSCRPRFELCFCFRGTCSAVDAIILRIPRRRGLRPTNYQVRHEILSFFLPHCPGAPRSERPLLPSRAGALWEGPVLFGRNRESRAREAAGRRNWPEAQENERQKKAGLPISKTVGMMN